MAHAQGSSGKSKNTNVTAVINGGGEAEEKPTTFHDFLGNKGQGQESAPATVDGSRPPPEVSPSSTSDLGSERNTGNHLEGIPYYGSRGDITGSETSNRFTGYKRSNSDSFMMSSRDKFPQGPSDSQDSPLLTKLLRYSGSERIKWAPREEETSFGGTNQIRPISASFISQPSTGGRTENHNHNNNNNPSKWDRVLQYPPRGGGIMPFVYQAQPNRLKEANANVGPPLVSQMAADEGSRTGIKGSGILSSINASGMVSGRQPAGVLIRSGKQKSGISISEPESSTMPSQRVAESSGQMTIFYGGQAHVFDNVHPNKADVIMTLAGSNGGSWSTTYNKANSTANPSTTGDNDPTAVAILRELHGHGHDRQSDK